MSKRERLVRIWLKMASGDELKIPRATIDELMAIKEKTSAKHPHNGTPWTVFGAEPHNVKHTRVNVNHIESMVYVYFEDNDGETGD